MQQRRRDAGTDRAPTTWARRGAGAAAAIALAAAGLGAIAAAPAATGAEERGAAAAWPTAEQAIAMVGDGVNLGNGYEAPIPGEWGVVVDEALLDAVVDGGFETIRFPVRFNAHALEVAPYTLDPTFMADVDAIVDGATERGLNVIVDLHHYDELHADPAAHRERFLAIWDQLADRYGDRPPTVWFELLNEPHGALTPAVWNDLAADALVRVRASNPQRIVLVGGTSYSSFVGLEDLEVPDDPHVVGTFHSYDPFPFTHQGADWVAGAEAWLGTRWTGTQDEIDFIHRVFDRADAFTERTGTPLILGEFGAFEEAPHADRIAWTDTVVCVAAQRGIPTIYWELAAGFGVWDVPTQTWDEPLLDAVLAPTERRCDRSAPATTTTTPPTTTTTQPAATPVAVQPTYTG